MSPRIILFPDEKKKVNLSLSVVLLARDFTANIAPSTTSYRTERAVGVDDRAPDSGLVAHHVC
jgi:hypothetical protein